MKTFYTLIIILLAFTATVKAQVSEQEFQALKALYNATGGDNWLHRTGWENINTTADKDDVTTAWFGIDQITDGHIIEFSTHGDNNLTGTLPPEIGNLQWLKSIGFYSNNITGTLPAEIGNLTQLEALELQNNNINGPLPIAMSDLVNLRVLRLNSNPLNCDFPLGILSNLTNLERVILLDCGLTGTLGDVFANLELLEAFDISNNNISGEIPPSINDLTHLYELHFNENLFTGELPTFEGSANSMYYLTFSGNQFTGSIPSTYVNFTKLGYFHVDYNQLSGTIPVGLFTATLQRIYIQGNFFTFNGIEPVFNQINALWQKYYDTDKIFPLHQNAVSFNKEEPLSLNASTLSVYNLGGNNNRYKWFKNDVEIYSGNNPVYSVPSVGVGDAGTYRFEVTNTVVTDIKLKSDNITVSVIGSNQAPTNISLNAVVIDENYTGLVGTLSASDPDAGDTHTFTLASGNGTNDKDNGYFSITGNQLNINSGANFEINPALNIFISANDGNGGIFTKAFVITVNNVNEAPYFDGQTTSNTIDENMPNGSTVLNLMAQDPEGSPVIYSIISGNDNGAFGIDNNKLVVSDNLKLNYDVKKSFTLGVMASDGELSSIVNLIVALNKINRLPEVQNATFNIDENLPVGTNVGSIVATDREGDPLTYSIHSGNELSAFTLVGNVLSVANSEPLDFETNPAFTIIINVTDGISTVQATVTINILNVAETTDNAIVTFNVPGIFGEAVIDLFAHTVNVTVDNPNLQSVTADFTLSPNAISNPPSGTTLNFSTPQTITVTSQSGTLQEWVVTLIYLTGKDEFYNFNMQFYPNPVSNYLTISGVEEGSMVKIVSINGQTLHTMLLAGDSAQIPVAKFPKGTYLMLIESNGRIHSQKFIKE